MTAKELQRRGARAELLRVFQTEDGSFYADGTYVGDWAAEKVSKKNVPASDDSQATPAVDRMLDALDKK